MKILTPEPRSFGIQRWEFIKENKKGKKKKESRFPSKKQPRKKHKGQEEKKEITLSTKKNRKKPRN